MTQNDAPIDTANVLANHDLVIVGRYALSDGSRYYLPEQRGTFLENLAEPFRTVKYVCYVRDLRTVQPTPVVEPENLEILPNEDWNSNKSLIRRAHSVRGDLASVTGDRLVTYTFYPGTYSFLLSPFVLRRGDTNVAYFGKSAAVSAAGLENGTALMWMQRRMYPRLERYVLTRSDVAFVRDPRVIRDAYEDSIELSKPITDAVALSDDKPSFPPLTDPIEILFVGSFRSTKGHKYLIDALAQLQRISNRAYRLRLVGDGPMRHQIETHAEDQGLTEHIDFLGYVSDRDRLLAIYESADVFALPSETEGFPRVLNEAMAAGLPVVTTNVGGIPTLLDDGEQALLVEPANPSALAAAIEKVVEDRELRDRLVEQGADFAQEHSGDPVEQHLDAIRRSID